MGRKQKIIVFCILITLAIAAGSLFYYSYLKNHIPIKDTAKENEIEKVTHDSCLEENEFADYVIDEQFPKEIKVPALPLTIFIQNKTTNEKRSFQIDNTGNPRGPRPQLRKCGVYVLRKFNYDPKKSIQMPGYREELWRYHYEGIGESVFLLTEKDSSGTYRAEFNNDFRISPNERYLVLEKSYLGKDDYALVVKDLAMLNDVLVLNLKNVLTEHLDVIPGSFGLGGWTKDGKYLRGDIFDGALSTAYYVIEADTWKVNIYAAPLDILAGVERAINFQNLHLAYVDIPTFTGVQEVYEQIIEKAKKEGKQKNLYIYNLRTKKQVKVASTDPEKRFNIKWLSDTELEYELPSGEKKIYTINKNSSL